MWILILTSQNYCREAANSVLAPMGGSAKLDFVSFKYYGEEFFGHEALFYFILLNFMFSQYLCELLIFILFISYFR